MFFFSVVLYPFTCSMCWVLQVSELLVCSVLNHNESFNSLQKTANLLTVFIPAAVVCLHIPLVLKHYRLFIYWTSLWYQEDKTDLCVFCSLSLSMSKHFLWMHHVSIISMSSSAICFFNKWAAGSSISLFYTFIFHQTLSTIKFVSSLLCNNPEVEVSDENGKVKTHHSLIIHPKPCAFLFRFGIRLQLLYTEQVAFFIHLCPDSTCSYYRESCIT